MGSFNKVPSVVQIAVVDMLIVWTLSSFIMAVWNTVRPGAFGEMSLRGIGNWVWFLLGFALFLWMLREIFKPRVKGETWSPINVGMFPGIKYHFQSTHPSYVLVDAVPAAVSGFLLWYAVSGNYQAKQFKLMFAVSLVVPALRLLAWYVLGLKGAADAESKNDWRPVAWFVIPVFTVFGIVGVAGLVSGRNQKAAFANLPVIDEQTFANGHAAFARLTGNSPQAKETGDVRLRARQTSDGPLQCKNSAGVDFASVMADLGTGGEVMIVGANYSHSGFDELVKKSSGNKGQLLEVIGKLRPMPPTGGVDNGKAYCGIGKLPRALRDRWVLEMHEP